MSIYATSTPTRNPLPAGYHQCNRCGITCNRGRGHHFTGYCVDCKPYAKADGLMEEA